MTHDELVNEVDSLTREMRSTNVSSYGLKVTKHEEWCKRMRAIADGIRELEVAKTKTPPSPPQTAKAAPAA